MNRFIMITLMGLTLTTLAIVTYLITGCKCGFGAIPVSIALTAGGIISYVLERRDRRGTT